MSQNYLVNLDSDTEDSDGYWSCGTAPADADDDPGASGSVPPMEPAAVTPARKKPLPRTMLDVVMECRDHPNKFMQQMEINSHQPFDVPHLCRLVADVFDCHVGCRGRRGKCYISVRAPDKGQAQLIANYIWTLTRSDLRASGRVPGSEYTHSFTLVTCGIRFLRMHPHDGMSAARRALTAVRRERGGYPPVDWVIDCRNFSDPDFSLNQRNHIGTHWKIQLGIVWNHQFVNTLRTIKDAVIRCMGQRHVTLALLCKSGRHRSVAVCELLRSCLMAEGFYVNVAHHSATFRAGWGNLCRGTCRDCVWSQDHAAMHNLASVIFKSL